MKSSKVTILKIYVIYQTIIIETLIETNKIFIRLCSQFQQ